MIIEFSELLYLKFFFIDEHLTFWYFQCTGIILVFRLIKNTVSFISNTHVNRWCCVYSTQDQMLWCDHVFYNNSKENLRQITSNTSQTQIYTKTHLSHSHETTLIYTIATQHNNNVTIQTKSKVILYAQHIRTRKHTNAAWANNICVQGIYLMYSSYLQPCEKKLFRS